MEWLRAGYPNGVPQGDYIPLVALLRRQLTDDEVDAVAAELVAESQVPEEPISKIDAGVKISKVTHAMPHEADIDRVRAHLEAAGWPFDDSPLADETGPESGSGPDEGDQH